MPPCDHGECAHGRYTFTHGLAMAAEYCSRPHCQNCASPPKPPPPAPAIFRIALLTVPPVECIYSGLERSVLTVLLNEARAPIQA